ncbi:uncharacterized protein [Salminus brasiliensis]|uniref:uncharacterized protein n=1 Tax=Salminus brasiliensis TaxID=930266 RepID=UPI003B8364CB
MESEDTNCDEFQEKAGLKRKLTGPPRLLLGKSKSAAQDEKKSDVQASRKQRRDKNNGTPKHEVEEHQGNGDAGSESQQVTCQSLQPAFAVEEEETPADLQEESQETVSNSEQGKVKGQHGKCRLRRSRAKAAIRRVFFPAFTCVRRRKPSDIKTVEDGEDKATHDNGQDALTSDTKCELLPLSGDSFNGTERCEKKDGSKKGKRKFHARIWPIFKRLSGMPNSNQKQEKGCVGQDNHTFIEITSEKSAADQSDYCAPGPSGDKAVDEQLKGSKEIHEGMARIHEESCPEKELDHEEVGTEKVTLSAEVNRDVNTAVSHEKVEQWCCPEQDLIQCHLPNIKDEEDTRMQNTETSEPPGLLDSQITSNCVNESDSDISVPEASPDIAVAFLNNLDEIVPVENEVKCKPVITIDSVHSSDEENQEPLESSAPQRNLLSALVAVNGSCHRFKVNRATKDTLHTLDQSDNNSQFSEIMLVQTAFSLVHAAISSAMEQLSAELQNNQIDQDHA